MKIRLILLALALFSATANAGELEPLFDEYWNYELEQNPFLATVSGDYRFNDNVPDAGAAAQRARIDMLGEFARRLAAAEPGADDALSVGILEFILKHDLALGAFEAWRIPFLSDAGFHMEIGYVVSFLASPLATCVTGQVLYLGLVV